MATVDLGSRFHCPSDFADLTWPAAECPTCGRIYRRQGIGALAASAPNFEMYDFRGDGDREQQDRQDSEAHARIIKGLAHFEARRLAQHGYTDLQAGIERDLAARVPRATSLALRLSRTASNWWDYVSWKRSGVHSRKASGDDSVESSWEGYSKTYELISSFTDPNWFCGWVDGQLRRAPAILHHYRNMAILSETLARWDCHDVLEFGCGSAVNLLLLQRAFEGNGHLKLSGFDYTDARVLTALSTIQLHDLDVQSLFLGDGRQLPLKDASFDVVFSHYVLEQMAGYEEAALDSMLRAARVGVILFESAAVGLTWSQRQYMAHSGYSQRLAEAVGRRSDLTVERIENLKSDRFFGEPNVVFLLKKTH